MALLLNNCHRYQHAKVYGRGAFFDLNSVGHHADLATQIVPGAECVVATPNRSGEIVFAWFSFARETVVQTASGKSLRVFFGDMLRSETLARPDAIKAEPYSAFFDSRGYFKRQSVIATSKASAAVPHRP